MGYRLRRFYWRWTIFSIKGSVLQISIAEYLKSFPPDAENKIPAQFITVDIAGEWYNTIQIQ
jgi:hypothetical protein